jgi:hypothetical protein
VAFFIASMMAAFFLSWALTAASMMSCRPEEKGKGCEPETSELKERTALMGI